MDAGTIILSIIFGAVGTGYIVYGRKQQKGLPLLVGVALLVFPYFVSNLLGGFLLGCGLCVLPFFIDF